MLVANYGPDAVGPAILDLESDAPTPRTRTGSLDSGYHSMSKLGPVNEALAILPNPQKSGLQIAMESNPAGALGAHEEGEGGLDIEEDASKEPIKEAESGRFKNTVVEPRKKDRGQMKLHPKQRRGTVRVSEVVAGGVMSKSGKARISESSGLLGLGSKWGR